jgi:hypothetical protein
MLSSETYSEVRVGKHLSDIFYIQNDLQVGDALRPLLFIFALEYAIRKAQEGQVGLKLNGTRHFLVYVHAVSSPECRAKSEQKESQ